MSRCHCQDLGGDSKTSATHHHRLPLLALSSLAASPHCRTELLSVHRHRMTSSSQLLRNTGRCDFFMGHVLHHLLQPLQLRDAGSLAFGLHRCTSCFGRFGTSADIVDFQAGHQSRVVIFDVPNIFVLRCLRASASLALHASAHCGFDFPFLGCIRLAKATYFQPF